LSTATDIIEYMAQLPDDKETGINKETSKTNIQNVDTFHFHLSFQDNFINKLPLWLKVDHYQI
jgi:hypothetical protein